MTLEIKDKVVAITGAGKGLGRAYAHYLAAHGAKVVVNNRSHTGEPQSSADKVVAEIVAAGGTAVAETSSVEDPASGDRLLAVALDNFGRIDALIANAAIIENATFRKQTLEELRHNLDINLVGTLNVTHPMFRHMCEQRSGSIVIAVSSAGLFGQLGLPGYSTSKAALIGLMRSLSLEGRSRNVAVNAISPYAATQMTDGHVTDAAFERLAPEHVAPVAAWLTTGAVSGEVIVAGGGGVARAKMKTTATLLASGFNDADWQKLSSAALDLEFESGYDNYEKFLASLDA
jgi:NAD(P)-dependent dehydrogenase (short-subunit alcohol dehydrogenase family)